MNIPSWFPQEAAEETSEGDFAALDRCARRIQGHMLVALLAGVAVGLAGTLLSGVASSPVLRIVMSAVLVSAVAVSGYLSAGLGWALLNSALTTFGAVFPGLVMSVSGGDFIEIAGGGVALDGLLFRMVAIGALAYLARSRSPWGDVAAGGLALLFLTDMAESASSNGTVKWHGMVTWDRGPALPWLAGTALVLGLLCVVLSRRSWAGRTRAAGVAAVLTAVYAL
ncbi:hypothetical protein N5079_27885 [Planotetraspora sp. A-T 1434]|uniref:hypothetical protein n=1 Tax=Planotetraspora sp. A-T 1434 TaxID=2979219 RepID=UPI0021BF3C1A|nr:hypothetical protein [Planotetraspora sp. A-T 1434]MCT9934037.1 hypothetical protein [Planotetraspora sp. A-T 1434]